MSTLDHRQRNINQKPVICTHTDVRRHLYIKKKSKSISIYQWTTNFANLEVKKKMLRYPHGGEHKTL